METTTTYVWILYGKNDGKPKKKQGNNNAKKNESKQNNPSDPQSNNKITIKFKKGEKVTNIEIEPNSMVCVLLNEYFVKEKVKNGTFKFNNITLSPDNCEEIQEVGLKNGDIINVS